MTVLNFLVLKKMDLNLVLEMVIVLIIINVNVKKDILEIIVWSIHVME